ncbi:hypothetical protein G7074_02905 [Pedobacter sp. HDW13]|uniref:hypothetical protein n=1 Tax=Pedobacter sp. HDW13 TaxID=2714940 RepID=UPI001409374D|nr:hypothetical protein [Pedobacter sp. HDW13]QIL38319.1 hypothetical protein G7074_02905 [Pedobacter sp. HDW13]
MYKLYLVALIIISSTLTKAQSTHKIALTKFATIDFPSLPITFDTLGVKTYRYSNDDAEYLVAMKDMTKLDGFYLKAENLKDFYRGLEESTLKGDKAKLISKRTFIVNGLEGIEMVYLGSTPSLPDLKFKRAIFINGIVISIDFMTSAKNKLQTQAERELFFNSFSIIGKKTDLKQETINRQVEEKQGFSYILERSFGYIFIIAFIIWLCRAFRTKQPED